MKRILLILMCAVVVFMGLQIMNSHADEKDIVSEQIDQTEDIEEASFEPEHASAQGSATEPEYLHFELPSQTNIQELMSQVYVE